MKSEKTETKRLLLRPWADEDAPSLFRMAKDHEIGDRAGFPVHTSCEHSLQIIREVLSQPVNYAVIRLSDGEVIGSVGCKLSHGEDPHMRQGDMEIGYWVGNMFWGQGYATEAVRALVCRVFEETDAETIWCATLPDNFSSRRVQEKCGFVFHHHAYGVPVPQLGTHRDLVYTCLTKQAWLEGMASRQN